MAVVYQSRMLSEKINLVNKLKYQSVELSDFVETLLCSLLNRLLSIHCNGN